MQSFKQFINEVGDSHYPFHHVEETDDGHAYEFHDGKHPYRAEIGHPISGKSEVVFARDDTHSMDRTHETGHKALRVFSTMKKIMKHHAINNPEVKHFEFASNKDDGNRSKLYHKFVKKAGGDSHVGNSYDTHIVSAKSL